MEPSLLVKDENSLDESLMEKMDRLRSGLMIRVVLSIVTIAGFLAGSLIYVAFGGNFNLLQQVVIVIVAMILALATLAILWITWAGRRGMIGRWWRD